MTCLLVHTMELWANNFVGSMTCLISVERYLAMARPFTMHKRSVLRNFRVNINAFFNKSATPGDHEDISIGIYLAKNVSSQLTHSELTLELTVD